jgi:hypothetical protein
MKLARLDPDEAQRLADWIDEEVPKDEEAGNFDFELSSGPEHRNLIVYSVDDEGRVLCRETFHGQAWS